MTTDELELSEHVADFFDKKIKKLSVGMAPINHPDLYEFGFMEAFAKEEVRACCQLYKSKNELRK